MLYGFYIKKTENFFFLFMTADSVNTMVRMAKSKSGKDLGTVSCLKMCVDVPQPWNLENPKASLSIPQSKRVLPFLAHILVLGPSQQVTAKPMMEGSQATRDSRTILHTKEAKTKMAAPKLILAKRELCSIQTSAKVVSLQNSHINSINVSSSSKSRRPWKWRFPWSSSIPTTWAQPMVHASMEAIITYCNYSFLCLSVPSPPSEGPQITSDITYPSVCMTEALGTEQTPLTPIP